MVYPPEEERWQVCQEAWETFSAGGYSPDDPAIFAEKRYRVSVPTSLEAQGVQLYLESPLLDVYATCGRMAIEGGLRPLPEARRPEVMLFDPRVKLFFPEKLLGRWEPTQASLLFVSEDGVNLANIFSRDYVGIDALLSFCLGGKCVRRFTFPILEDWEDGRPVFAPFVFDGFPQAVSEAHSVMVFAQVGEIEAQGVLEEAPHAP